MMSKMLVCRKIAQVYKTLVVLVLTHKRMSTLSYVTTLMREVMLKAT